MFEKLADELEAAFDHAENNVHEAAHLWRLVQGYAEHRLMSVEMSKKGEDGEPHLRAAQDLLNKIRDFK